MRCLVCGAEIPDQAQFCTNCNAPTGYENAPLSQSEFLKHPSMKKCKGSITSAAIVLYACAGITLLLNVILAQRLTAFLDIILLIGLGIGIQIGRSRICAVVATVYGVINVVVLFMMTGKISGWWILVAGIIGITSTFQYHSAWKRYQNTGAFPN